MSLKTTLGNVEWVTNHVKELQALLPEVWTNISNFNVLQFGYQLKLLGVDWRSQDELSGVLAFFEKSGLLLRDAFCIKRSNRF